MAEIILHQYVNSPFSEKIRKIMAYKKISWRAVEQPVIMPKPRLVPLTGGYRRIPVLQIGADVWCDTGIIIRKLEELHPEPSLYRAGWKRRVIRSICSPTAASSGPPRR